MTGLTRSLRARLSALVSGDGTQRGLRRMIVARSVLALITAVAVAGAVLAFVPSSSSDAAIPRAKPPSPSPSSSSSTDAWDVPKPDLSAPGATVGRPVGLAHTHASKHGKHIHIDVGKEGIPGIALSAYRSAARRSAEGAPSCGLTWEMLAGFGRIESDHGLVDAPVSAYTHSGTVLPSILGPRLDGRNGHSAIKDTDKGKLDGDARWDRAVGPMQFIPSTWNDYGADGNSDGRTDPNNIFDSSLATARYLCAIGLDLSNPRHLARAIFTFDHSHAYVHEILWVIARYSQLSPHALVKAAGPLAYGAPKHHHHHKHKHHHKRHKRSRDGSRHHSGRKDGSGGTTPNDSGGSRGGSGDGGSTGSNDGSSGGSPSGGGGGKNGGGGGSSTPSPSPSPSDTPLPLPSVSILG